MILYISPKDGTRNLLKLINALNKLLGCKTKTQNESFLYISNELVEKEIRKTTPLTIA